MRMRGIDGPGGVEISVFFLRGSDFFDERVEIRVELRVGMNAERVGSAFDHFEEVGIVEGGWRGTGVLLPPSAPTPRRAPAAVQRDRGPRAFRSDACRHAPGWCD